MSIALQPGNPGQLKKIYASLKNKSITIGERESEMWVFGYGSLMWDNWQKDRDCVRNCTAQLDGYKRAFNKASVVNWGSRAVPCPTLNLVRSNESTCQGMAFEFLEADSSRIIEYLEKREGKNFNLQEFKIDLDSGETVTAIIPIYAGRNIINPEEENRIVKLVLSAKGRDGSCVNYVEGIATQLRKMNIKDSAVEELNQLLKAFKQ